MNRSADVAISFCLVPVKGGDPFSCVHPTSINSLGKEALEEEKREDKCRESAYRPLVFYIYFFEGVGGVGLCEREAEPVRGCRGGNGGLTEVRARARSSSDGREEKADHKYARLRPAGS